MDALETEDVTVGELAYRLGYRSEAAFARAFKRVIGVSPGAVRRGGDGRAAAWRVAAQAEPVGAIVRRPASRAAAA